MTIVSRHAMDRWRERVDPAATPSGANRAVLRFLSDAQLSARPPRWTGRFTGSHQVRYATSSLWPGIALLVESVNGGDLLVTTVLTRDSCRRSAELGRSTAWRPGS